MIAWANALQRSQVCLVTDLEAETIKIQITMKKEQKLNNAITQALNIPVVSVRCCANCSHFNYVPPRFDQPYPEFWCGKEHWCDISSSEEYEGLNKPFECADFNAR